MSVEISLGPWGFDHGEEFVLTHERFTRGDVAKHYEGGWGTIADKLAAYLAKQKN